jgi:cytochrome c551/c552
MRNIANSENKNTVSLLLLISFLSIILLISSCNQTIEQEKVEKVKVESTADEKALTLLQNTCFVCHNPDLEIENRVAPPMFKIRSHYFDEDIKKQEFVDDIVQFVLNPSEENSIMPGAVRNFGLMPKQNFKENDIKTIAAYIFENDLESDEWYEKWEKFRKSTSTKTVKLSYEDLGLKYSNETKAQLGKNLLFAIKNYGSEGAVEFCNTRAISLTDSMSKVYNVSIKRVSDKVRNQNNKANQKELAFINELKSKKSKNEKLTSKLIEIDGKMLGYYPIETNKMCLQCHGTKEKDINLKTFQKIQNLYPNDKAIAYSENEIRGIWVVSMKK